MNIKSIFTLAVMAGVFFSGANAADRKKKTRQADDDAQGAPITTLNTAADSLSYAAGMVRTDGLIPYLKQSFGVDTAYMADFIRGYKEAMSKGFDERTKAYYAGEQIAQMVSQRMLPFLKDEFAGRKDSIDEHVFNEGFINALQGGSSLMTADAAKDYFNKAFEQAIDERNTATKKAGEEFLAANKLKPGVVTTPSGLQYKVLVKGTGEVPGEKDEVSVKYEGRLLDGTVFDSSYERKDPVTKFRPNQVIKGWTEALTMMPVGSKWELYIPYNLAYGERQAGKIKPFSTLVFTVEVVGVKKAEAPKPQPKNTPASAKGKSGQTLKNGKAKADK